MDLPKGKIWLSNTLLKKQAELDFTNQQMADRIGISTTTFRNYTDPSTKYVLSPSTLKKLAQFLKMSEVEIFILAYQLEGETPDHFPNIVALKNAINDTTHERQTVILELLNLDHLNISSSSRLSEK